MNACEVPIQKGANKGAIPTGTPLGRQRHRKANEPYCATCAVDRRKASNPSRPKRQSNPKPDWNVLVPKAQAGDQVAKQEILDGMKGLMIKIARKAAGAEMWQTERADLLQAASVGVLEAIKRYDPNHPSGLKFSSVVGYRIQAEVWEYVASNAGAVRITRHAWAAAGKADQAAKSSGARPANEYSDKELVEMAGNPSGVAAVRARMNAYSLSTPTTSAAGSQVQSNPYEPIHDDENDTLTDDKVLDFLDRLWHMRDEDRQTAAERFVAHWGIDTVTAEDLLAAMDQVYGGGA